MESGLVTAPSSVDASASSILLQDKRRSIILDGYGDIFSSFDPRHYTERTISTDFVDECSMIISDKEQTLDEVRFLIPNSMRKEEDEYVIKKRLHSYFLGQAHIDQKGVQRGLRIAVAMIAIGVILGVIVSYSIHSFGASFWKTLLTVIGEPASWFCIWTGADKLLYYKLAGKKKYLFNWKMAHAKYVFVGY